MKKIHKSRTHEIKTLEFIKNNPGTTISNLKQNLCFKAPAISESKVTEALSALKFRRNIIQAEDGTLSCP